MNYSLLLFLLFSTFVSSNTLKPINISVSNDGKFDIVYHRFQSTVTGAVLGGLIGGTIEEGVRKAKDTKKEKQILKLLLDSSCNKRMLGSLIEKLKDNNFSVKEENALKKNKKSKFWLNIKILRCGFKMVNSSTMEVSAYVDFKTTIRNKNKIIKKKKYSIKAKKQYSYQELSSDALIINEELNLVLKKAGQRLANKLIYQ